MIDRRGFLATCLAMSAAPMIVRAESLMLMPRRTTIRSALTWEIDTSEALRAMDDALFRNVIVPPQYNSEGKLWLASYTNPQIFHEGTWKNLCRTDFCDDVATGWCTNKTVEQWVEHYRCKARRSRFGARFDRNRFSIIDALSDG